MHKMADERSDKFSLHLNQIRVVTCAVEDDAFLKLGSDPFCTLLLQWDQCHLMVRLCMKIFLQIACFLWFEYVCALCMRCVYEVCVT